MGEKSTGRSLVLDAKGGGIGPGLLVRSYICREENAAILSMVRDGQLDFFRGEIDTPGLLDLVKDFCFEGTKQHIQLMGLENFQP